MQRHRCIEHVGEIELELEAESAGGVFAEALAAFRELVDGAGTYGPPRRHEIEIAGETPPALLAHWLEELAFLADAQAFVPARVVEIDVTGSGLRSIVEGNHGRPRHVVKAVTFDHLELVRSEGRWHGHVVLDV